MKPKPNPAPKEDIWFSTPVRDVVRRRSGLWSFDLAIGGGMPERAMIELAAYDGVGKSSLGSYLLGLAPGEVALCPLEAYDPEYLRSNLRQAGFKGAVWEVPSLDEKKKLRDDEAMLDAFLEKLADENVPAAFLDSVGAISPIAEEEGSVREANMGRRARIMGPFMRKAERILLRLRQTPAIVILANHQHPNLGVPGSTTSGGKAIHFHCLTRVRLAVGEKYEDGSRVIEGRVNKLRFRGGAKNEALFHVVLKAGLGVHPGLTAVQDCLDFELAEKVKGTGVVSLNGKSYGRHNALVFDHYADRDRFTPFLAALEKMNG